MSDTPSLLHPVAIGQVMINFAAEHGVDAETCLQGTGIDKTHLLDSEALIPREQEMRLIENLMLALPDVPALGIRLGLRYNVSTFGIWGFALRTSRTLRDVAARALRYLPLSTAYCRMELIERDGMLGVSMDPGAIPAHLRQFLLERDMATAINLLRELSLSGVTIQVMELQCAEPDYGPDLAALCGITPRYECRTNALYFRAEDADRPLPTYDEHLVRMLEDQCRAQLQRRSQTGITGQVRELLLGRMGLVAGIEEVAAALSISPRSLRRKLETENTSFRALLEQERRQLAEKLLGGSQMTQEELALHLGYADTASFTRAFRRWFDCSPGEFRRRAAE